MEEVARRAPTPQLSLLEELAALSEGSMLQSFLPGDFRNDCDANKQEESFAVRGAVYICSWRQDFAFQTHKAGKGQEE